MVKEQNWLITHKNYVRRDDDSTDISIIIHEIETGEVHLDIHRRGTGEGMHVGFTNAIGGGRSPHTLEALKNLALAIEKDNKEHPIEIERNTPSNKLTSANKKGESILWSIKPKK